MPPFSSLKERRIKFYTQLLFPLFIPYLFQKPIPMPAMTNLPLSLARDGFAISARLPSPPRVYLSQPSTSAGEEIGADEDEDYSTHLRYDSLISLQFLPSAHGYRSHE